MSIIKKKWKKWGLKTSFTIAKRDLYNNPTQWLTTFPVDSQLRLKELVEPYIIDSMKYKFDIRVGKQIILK